MLFWYVVWAVFTIFWFAAGPGSTGLVTFPEYLLIVAVPSFFPISAIAYTLFQSQRKVESLHDQFSLLGLAKLEGDGGDEHKNRSDEITERFQKTQSTTSFSTQTILPVLLSVIGVAILILPSEAILKYDVMLDKLEASIDAIDISVMLPADGEEVSSIEDLTKKNTALLLALESIEERQDRAEKFVRDHRPALAVDLAVLMALRYGFLGAYVFCVQLIYRRYTTLDLKPSIYMQCTATLLAGLAFNYVAFEAISALTGEKGELTGLSAGLAAIVAFSLGYFPGFAIRWFNRVAYQTVGSSSREADALPLSLIDGLSDFHEVRLRDEGIDNIQNLASAHVEALIVNTPFNTLQIVDWIDQAILRLYVTQDHVAALRRGGVRGIADFRDLWQRTDERRKSKVEANGNGIDGNLMDLTKKSLADRFQSTPEELEILYLATESAPNLAFLDYPRKFNEVVREKSDSAKSEEIGDVYDGGFFVALLKHIGELNSHTELNAELVSVFGASERAENGLNSEIKQENALSLARWHRRLSEDLVVGEKKELEERSAHDYYTTARENDPSIIPELEQAWYDAKTDEYNKEADASTSGEGETDVPADQSA